MIKLRLERKAPDLVEIYKADSGVYLGEYIMDVDGFYVYFPSKLDGTPVMGGFTEDLLEEILKQLTEINKEWKDSIYNFFKTKKPVEIQEDFNF